MKISKWGNSAAVRISSFITEASGISVDDYVEIRPEPGRIVIQKVNKPKKKQYDLAALIANTPASVLQMDDDWNNEAPMHGELI
jgi:antitoxin component of MazEF toxin-antitoxin module